MNRRQTTNLEGVQSSKFRSDQVSPDVPHHGLSTAVWTKSTTAILVSKSVLLSFPKTHTFPESFRILGDNPMARVNIYELKAREEPPDNGERFIGNVVALCTADKQRRALIACLVWVFKREVSHVGERR
jgi:hypothetical protein